MKNIFLGLMLLFSFGLQSQTEEKTIFSPPREKSELMDLAKILFIPENSISFNISEKHVKSSFGEIKDGEKYDEEYLKGLLSNLKKDSLNPFYIRNLAEYYNKTGQAKLAKRHYLEAYENLDSFYKGKEKDSASYYSMRGFLKNNLGDSTAFNDFEKAIIMNPTDSISMAIYPIILIGTGKLDEAKAYVVNLNDANSKCETIPYILLFSGEGFFQKMIMGEVDNDSISKVHQNKNYDEIFNLELLDKYASLCKDSQEIQNARLMIDILSLFGKMVSNKSSDFKISTYNNYVADMSKNYKTNLIKFNSYEVNEIKKIIKKLSYLEVQNKLNEYTLNQCFGYVYFMLKDWKKSISYLNKAIEVFPTEKTADNFNPAECYDLLSFIYFNISDTTNFRKILNKKIANETYEGNTLDDQMKLAFDYFLTDDLMKAEEYCGNVRKLNLDNFDALRLLAHINFLNGSKSLSQFQIEWAGRYIRSNEDFYNLLMQSAIYQIYNGDIKPAKANIGKAKEVNGNDCDLCDKLLKEYCVN